MANPRTIKEQIATRLRSIAGLTVYDNWPNVINPPCAVVAQRGAEPEQTFGRGDMTKWDFDVYVLVSLAGGYEQAQDNLDPYLATSSTGGIYGAIQADRRLANTVAGTFVKGYRDYGQFDLSPDMAMEGAIVELEIWAT